MLTGGPLSLWHDASIVDQDITGLQSVAPDNFLVSVTGLHSTSDTSSTKVLTVVRQI